jgi:hypothetical protein
MNRNFRGLLSFGLGTFLFFSGYFVGLNTSRRYSLITQPTFLKLDRWTGRVWTYYGENDGKWRELR